MCKTFVSDVYMKRMNSINYNLSYLLIAVRYWCDNYISDPWALATDIWCCQGLATAPQPFLWHNNGRGQPEGWGREAAERCQPPDSNSRQASGPFTGNYRCAQPTGEGRKGGEGGWLTCTTDSKNPGDCWTMRRLHTCIHCTVQCICELR